MNATPTGPVPTLDLGGRVHVPLREARRRLGISRETAYRWRDKGWLTFVKHEGRVWCPESETFMAGKESANDRS